MKINAQYNIASAGSLPVRIAGHQRRKMYQAFLDLGMGQGDTILDIGATSDRSYDHSNYLEAWYPYKNRITAVGIDHGARFLENAYPGVRFVRANGRVLPFPDNSFDYAHSSAVLEHVGDRGQQAAFVSEVWRVTRKAALVTTPNRWFPVEFHTILPLVHWLPAPAFRALLRRGGRSFFADERNLNLLSASDLLAISEPFRGHGAVEVGGVTLCGWVSNLLLSLRKRPLKAAIERCP